MGGEGINRRPAPGRYGVMALACVPSLISQALFKRASLLTIVRPMPSLYSPFAKRKSLRAGGGDGRKGNPFGAARHPSSRQRPFER
jgi:hypothetical protein